jgi:6-pyruvoyltetrahydropterin/6-carboxytetrahydropterin synthase
MSTITTESLPPRRDIVYGSTKQWAKITSTAFRQHAADSHCHFIHGYDFVFEATFEASYLDKRNWVVDFGSLKTFKGWLEKMFDHTTLVAKDDPGVEWFYEAERREIIDLRIVEATGCEAIARLCFEYMEMWLQDNGYFPRVRLVKFEVREHDGNSAYVRIADVRQA